jgi:DNA modification methylase
MGGRSQWEDTKEREWCKSGYRNRRSVWTVTTQPFKEAHFATFPEDLIEPCVLAGCPEGGIVIDPFMGAGTTAVVAKKNHRQFIGVELNPAYIEMAVRRIDATLVNRKLNFGCNQ